MGGRRGIDRRPAGNRPSVEQDTALIGSLCNVRPSCTLASGGELLNASADFNVHGRWVEVKLTGNAA